MSEIARDPVCGMVILVEDAPAAKEYDGQTFYFCTVLCSVLFELDPDRYLGNINSSEVTIL